MLNEKDLQDLTRIKLKASPDIRTQEILRANRSRTLSIFLHGLPYPKQYQNVRSSHASL